MFSDFADTAVAARTLHELATEPGYARCLTAQIRSAKDLRPCQASKLIETGWSVTD